jgi:hypothetical protein
LPASCAARLVQICFTTETVAGVFRGDAGL